MDVSVDGTARVHRRFATNLILVLALLAPLSAFAQSNYKLEEKGAERLNAARKVAPLSADTLFGDRISHFNGNVTFRVTDVSVPGNNELPVELGRLLTIDDRRIQNGTHLSGFGEWDLDIPHLYSVVSQMHGWAPSATRCSSGAEQPMVSTIAPEDYWDGYKMRVRGGEQTLLNSPTAGLPSPSGTFPWITKELWRLGCKATTKNGYPGQAFFARSPDGLTYHFDWGISRPHAGVVNGMDPSRHVQRQVVYFLVTRVEDRFGNWVDYAYSGSKLTGISASDGRSVTVNWSGDKIASVNSSVGTWSDVYSGEKLTGVVQPDSSQWSYSSTGAMHVYPPVWSPGVEDPTGCPEPLEPMTGDYSLTVNAPTGASATYDLADRLTDAGSCNFGGDCWHRMTYDAIDNLKSWKLPGVKDYANYQYDGRNLPTQILNTGGTAVVTQAFDVQGNLNNKNGQSYTFDVGNRLREVSGKEWSRYDGYGHRVLRWQAAEAGILALYSHDGKLLYDDNYRAAMRTSHAFIHLQGSLLATWERSMDTGAVSWKYQHTDALGSPVATTNQAGTVIERNEWEPWGKSIGKPTMDTVGYTGHQMDGVTGNIYMQQRYYDPDTGQMMSVDPVYVDPRSGVNFNRRWYANNNPYRFKDIDGRETIVVINNNFPVLGTHAGLMVRRGNESTLYDPAGSFKNVERGSGGILDGENANLGEYVRFQKVDGPDVFIFRFDTTPAEEKKIISNMEEIADRRGFTCAISVSEALNGIGIFKDLGVFRTPSGLYEAMISLKVKEKQDENPKVPDPPKDKEKDGGK